MYNIILPFTFKKINMLLIARIEANERAVMVGWMVCLS